MIRLEDIKNSLAFKVIFLVVTTTLALGISLYIIVTNSIYNFLDEVIREDMYEKAWHVYNFSDKRVKEIINNNAVDDVKIVNEEKNIAAELIDDYLKHHNFKGFIFEKDRIFRNVNNPPEVIIQEVNKDMDKTVTLYKHAGKNYYLTSVSFEPWKWKILIIKDMDDYAYFIDRIKITYYTIGIILLIGAFFLLYYLKVIIRTPLDAISIPLKKGEKPAYKGLKEFEFLSNSIREMMTEKEYLMQQIIEEQKLKGLNILAHGIAHNFNNILVVVMGYAAIMRMKLEEARQKNINLEGDAINEFFKYLDIIENSAQKASNLSKELIALAHKKLSEDIIATDINKLVLESLHFFKKSIPANIEVVTNLINETVIVECSISQIKQAIINILNNAIDSMPGGGRLTIESFVTIIDEKNESIPFLNKGQYVCIKISDTGVGMDKETLSHIFEPFFTTKSPAKNTGLGLATAYSIIKDHKGYIIANSILGQGSTFTIYLPIVHKNE